MSYQPFSHPSVQHGGGFAEFLEAKKPKTKKKRNSLGVVKVENQSGKGRKKSNTKSKKKPNILGAVKAENQSGRGRKKSKTKKSINTKSTGTKKNQKYCHSFALRNSQYV